MHEGMIIEGTHILHEKNMTRRFVASATRLIMPSPYAILRASCFLIGALISLNIVPGNAIPHIITIYVA